MALPALVGALGRVAGGAATGAGAAGATGAQQTLTRLSTTLNSVSFAAANTNALFGAVGSSITSLASPLTNATGLLRRMETTITALGYSVGHFVEKANPALFRQFTFAADDLTASIGRGLLPVMQFATRVTRAFADVFFAFAGPINRLLDATLRPLGDYVAQLTNVFGPLARAFGSIVNLVTAVTQPFNTMLLTLARVGAVLAEISFTMLADALELVLAPLEALIRVFGDVVKAIAEFINNGLNRLREFFGLTDIAGASTGAAVRQTSMGSVEGFQQKAFMAAFMGGAGEDPARRTATLADLIYQWLTNRVPQLLKEHALELAAKLGDLLKGFALAVADGPATAAGRTVEEAASIGKAAGRWLDNKRKAAARELEELGDFFGI
jgi:hypothetical protein